MFHLVCRDCAHERLWSTKEQAHTDKYAHHRTFGHTTALAEVAGYDDAD